MAACPEDWVTQQITQYANVQTQTQSTVRHYILRSYIANTAYLAAVRIRVAI